MFYVLADKGKHNCYLQFSSAELPFSSFVVQLEGYIASARPVSDRKRSGYYCNDEEMF